MRHLAANQALRIKLGETVSTTNPQWSISVFRVTNGTDLQGEVISNDGELSDTNYLQIVIPFDEGVQDIDELTVSNLDNVSHTIYLQKIKYGIVERTFQPSTIPAGDMLRISRGSWEIVNL